jgi:hypothetical protein
MDEELGQRSTKVQPGGSTTPARPSHHLSLPDISADGEKNDELGNMYAAYNLLRRVASPVVNGQNQQRPLHIGNPAVLGKVARPLPVKKEIMQQEPRISNPAHSLFLARRALEFCRGYHPSWCLPPIPAVETHQHHPPYRPHVWRACPADCRVRFALICSCPHHFFFVPALSICL